MTAERQTRTAKPRPRADRQQLRGGSGRPQRPHRMVVLPPLRFRSRLFAAVGGRRGERVLRCRARRARRERVALCPQHGDRRDDPDRREGREAAGHRFRAALRSVRARVPAAADHSSHRAGRRSAAARHSRSPDPRLRTPDDGRRRRLQSYPLRRRGAGDAADDRRAALLRRQRDHLSADASAVPDLRPGRTFPERDRGDEPPNFSTGRAITGSSGRAIWRCRSNGSRP